MSIFDSILGTASSDASNAAAADTYRKQKKAAQGIMSYGDTLPEAYSGLSEAYDPYTNAGSSAVAQLMAGLGLGGNGQDFTNAYRSLPGYQAGLDTGLTGVARKYNAGGMGQSGAAMKGLYRFGSDYEDQRAGDYLSRLMGLSTMGLGATGSQVGTQAQGLQGQLATRQSGFQGQMGAAPTVGQGMVAGAQAEQQALTNLMGLIANGVGQFAGGAKAPTSSGFGLSMR